MTLYCTCIKGRVDRVPDCSTTPLSPTQHCRYTAHRQDALESDSLHKANSFYHSSNSSDKWAGSAPLFYTLLMLLLDLSDRDALAFIITFRCEDGFSQTSVSLRSVSQMESNPPPDNNSDSLYRPSENNKQTRVTLSRVHTIMDISPLYMPDFLKPDP